MSRYIGPYRPTWEPLFDLFGSFDPDPVVQKMINEAMERAHFHGKDWVCSLSEKRPRLMGSS